MLVAVFNSIILLPKIDRIIAIYMALGLTVIVCGRIGEVLEMADLSDEKQAFLDCCVPVVIGVTGHRDLVSEQLGDLEESVRNLLMGILNHYSSSPVIVMSALAEGADRLVARVALELAKEFPYRVRLYAPLPMPSEEYMNDFITEESRREYLDLLQQAVHFVVSLVPDDPSGYQKPYRTDYYARGGAYIARHSHILLALWDGVEKEENYAGTSGIVSLKIKGEAWHKYQDLLLKSITPARNSLLNPPEKGLVCHIVTPRQSNPDGKTKEPCSAHVLVANGPTNWTIDFEKFKRRGDLEDESLANTEIYNADIWQIKSRQPGSEAEIAVDYQACVKMEHISEEDVQASITLKRSMVASRLAGAFERKKVKTLWGILSLLFLAELSFELYAHLYIDMAEMLPLIAVYPTFIVGSVVFYYWIVRKHYKEKHQDYRALAEALRVQFYWQRAGIPYCVSEFYLSRVANEMEWIRRALRASNIPVTTGRTPRREDGILRVYQNILARWIGDTKTGQIAYFADKAKKHRRKARQWEWGATALLALGVLSSSGYVVAYDCLRNAHKAHEATVFIGILPLLAAACVAYSEKMLFAEQANQYAKMGVIFHHARREYERLLKKGDWPSLNKLIMELGQEALDENADWVWQHRQRHIKPHH